MRPKDHEFKPETKEQAAKRVGFTCSFPGCCLLTIGPNAEGNTKSINTGEAAHINSAAPGGKRYDPNLTVDQIISIDNCIHLCGTHHKIIDSDECTYTVEELKRWKREAEESAALRQSGNNHADKGSFQELLDNYISLKPAFFSESDFIGRETELQALNNFIENDSVFQLCALTGEGGSGKSRLAYEFYKRNADKKGWKFIYVTEKTFPLLMRTDLDYSCKQNILLIIDNISDISYLASWLYSYNHANKQPSKLRVLIVERQGEIQRQSIRGEKLKIYPLWKKNALKDFDINLNIRLASFCKDKEYVDYVKRYAKYKNRTITNREIKLLLSQLDEIDNLRRPLFLEFIIDSYFDGVDLNNEKFTFNWGKNNFIENIHDKFITTIKKNCEGYDTNIFDTIVLLHVLAAANGKLSIDESSLSHKRYISNLSLSKSDFRSIISGISGIGYDGTINKIQPDILAEFFVLKYLSEILNNEKRQQVISDIWDTSFELARDDKEYEDSDYSQYNSFTKFLFECNDDFEYDEFFAENIFNEILNFAPIENYNLVPFLFLLASICSHKKYLFELLTNFIIDKIEKDPNNDCFIESFAFFLSGGERYIDMYDYKLIDYNTDDKKFYSYIEKLGEFTKRRPEMLHKYSMVLHKFFQLTTDKKRKIDLLKDLESMKENQFCEIDYKNALTDTIFLDEFSIDEKKENIEILRNLNYSEFELLFSLLKFIEICDFKEIDYRIEEIKLLSVQNMHYCYLDALKILYKRLCSFSGDKSDMKLKLYNDAYNYFHQYYKKFEQIYKENVPEFLLPEFAKIARKQLSRSYTILLKEMIVEFSFYDKLTFLEQIINYSQIYKKNQIFDLNLAWCLCYLDVFIKKQLKLKNIDCNEIFQKWNNERPLLWIFNSEFFCCINGILVGMSPNKINVIFKRWPNENQFNYLKKDWNETLDKINNQNWRKHERYK